MTPSFDPALDPVLGPARPVGVANADGPRKVFLHVGAPMVASDLIQRALWANRHRLREQGICYPLDGPREHFEAAMDLRGTAWAGRRHPSWDGAWARVAGRIRDCAERTVILSQEQLGGVAEAQAEQAVESLRPAHVHVIFAARDLATQLAVDWQEHLQHAHTISFEDFTDELVQRGINAAEPFGPMFWGLHDPERVLAAWRTAVPPERMHLITAPPVSAASGAESGKTAWSRFAVVTGIDTTRCDLTGIEETPPLGVVAAELLRVLNHRIGPALGQDYESIGREYLARRLLSGRAGQAPITLPERHRAWAVERSRQLVDGIRAAGCAVAGDLRDLEPVFTADEEPLGERVCDQVSPDELAAVAVEVIADLLWDLARVGERAHMARINHELSEVRGRLDRLAELSAARRSPVRRFAGALRRRLRDGWAAG